MKLLRYLVAATMMMSPFVSAEPLRLTSFDTSDANLNWQIVNDTVMGGRSSSEFRVENQQLTFSGTLNTNGGGFASLRSARQAWDLSAYRLFRLRVKGDGRSYRLRLFTDNDRASYQQTFTTRADEWVVVDLPVSEFYASWRGRRLRRPPLNARDIAGIGFILADGIDGSFRLCVDWIEVDVLR